MSERGLILAIQRFHDDPGFWQIVAQDPQTTLGIYDLSEDERDAILDSVSRNDHEEITQLAKAAGLDWNAEHLSGVGALPDDDDTTTGRTSTHAAGTGTAHAFTGEGYADTDLPRNTPGSGTPG